LKKNEIKLGAVLSYVVIALNMIIGLAYTPFLIRLLGQSEYGLYSLVSSIISYLTVLDLGFGNAIIVYTARYREKGEFEKEQKLHGMFLIIYSLLGILSIILGAILYFNINNMFSTTMTELEIETAKKLMIILTINLAVTFPFTIFSSIITAYEKFVFSKILNIIRIILNPIIMIPLLLLGYKSIALVVVITILNIITILINAIYCLKKLKIKLKFGKIDKGIFKEITSYSVWIFLNSIIDKINWSLDQFVLGAVSGTVAVSVYAAAAKINTMYMNFSNAISGVLLPKVTKMEANNASDEEFTEIFIKTGRIQYLVLALLMTGFVIFGQRFMEIWAGNGYGDAYIIACILMIPITIPLIQNVGLAILQAKNKYKYRTMIFLAIAVLNVIISIPLAQKFQGIGSAIGTAIAQILGQCIIINVYYHKKIHIDIIKFWRNILKMSIPMLIAFCLGFTLNKLIDTSTIIVYLALIGVYTLIYCTLVWKFAMNKYEKDLIRKVFSKFKKKRVVS